MLAPTASFKCYVLWRQQWQCSHSGWRQVPDGILRFSAWRLWFLAASVSYPLSPTALSRCFTYGVSVARLVEVVGSGSLRLYSASEAACSFTASISC